MNEEHDEDIADSDRDFDKPRGDAEMRALTERQSGCPRPPKRGRWRGASIHGHHSAINEIIWDDDAQEIDPYEVRQRPNPLTGEDWKPSPALLRQIRIAPIAPLVMRSGWVDPADIAPERLLSPPGPTTLVGPPTYLARDHVVRLYNAVWAADRLGLIMNVCGTISWYLVFGDDQEAAARCHKQFWKYGGQWLADNDYDHSAYIWVNENPKNIKFHTHFMMHVPFGLADEFREWAVAHFQKVLKQPICPRFLDMPIRRARDFRSQWEWLRYMAKGYDPSRALFEANGKVFGLGHVINRRHEDPGCIEGEGVQRYGISRALHRKQYRKILQTVPGETARSPLDLQLEARKIFVGELYADFGEACLEPQGRPRYAKRQDDRKAEKLEQELDKVARSLNTSKY
jgi:hypothetical protein